MNTDRVSYYSNLIGYIYTFMEVVDNGSIRNEKALQYIEQAKQMAEDVLYVEGSLVESPGKERSRQL